MSPAPAAVPRTGTSKRYETKIDAEAHLSGGRTPVTLPQRAYCAPINWSDERQPVWAWIHWLDGPAERIPAIALGWNDRVAGIGWPAEGGERKCVLWRNAVMLRNG